jgi:threonine dehydratase
MTDPAHWLPLTPASVRTALDRIRPFVHRTPILTSRSIDRIASTPQQPGALVGSPFEGRTPATPRLRLFFKCENLQRIGAFKARGAFHAILRLRDERGIEELRRRGVITHSSGMLGK